MSDPIDADPLAARRARGGSPHLLRWGLLVVAAVVLLRIFVVSTVSVQSDSMRPTIPPGSSVLIEKVSPRLVTPGVGSFVVFREPTDGRLAVKRVVANAGSTVAIEDAQLVVDGHRADEPFVDHESIDGLYFGPVAVPDGTVFLMGDNRARSIDSRAYGAVPVTDLVGRVLLHW